MATATITCPRCSQILTPTRPLVAGDRLRCPKCGDSFVAPPPSTGPATPPTFPGVRPLPPPLDDKPSGRGARRLLVAATGLGLLLLAGAGVALTLYCLARSTPSLAVAKPPPSSANDPTAAPTPEDGPSESTDNAGRPNPSPRRPDSPPDLPRPDLAPYEPPPAALSVLPPEEQEKVNKAIDRGIEYLKKAQEGDGVWGRGHPVGMAALPGLTLLECGVPPDDSHVRKAAEFVRKAVATHGGTYGLSLAILFLDRLGDPQDEPLIRTLALRLLAGETPAGGWSYQCPLLSDKEERTLLTILETTRPRSSLDLMAARDGGNDPADLFTGRLGGGVAPLSPDPDEKARQEAKAMYDGLSNSLKKMPALQPPTREEKMPARDDSDNSNTHFAALGLWAAGRHAVPMERALALLARRFQVSQTPAGGWEYHYQPKPTGGETATMTGAGLVGLAVGHGLTADLNGADREAAGEDPQVEKAMKLLGDKIGKAHGGGKGRARPLERNYYFLWLVERVGMLYGRKDMGDKEWYPWGAEDLVEMQEKDGAWRQGIYFGAQPAIDTSFALLFLKRANLAKDLTTKLQFLTQIKER